LSSLRRGRSRGDLFFPSSSGIQTLRLMFLTTSSATNSCVSSKTRFTAGGYQTDTLLRFMLLLLRQDYSRLGSRRRAFSNTSGSNTAKSTFPPSICIGSITSRLSLTLRRLSSSDSSANSQSDLWDFGVRHTNLPAVRNLT